MYWEPGAVGKEWFKAGLFKIKKCYEAESIYLLRSIFREGGEIVRVACNIIV